MDNEPPLDGFTLIVRDGDEMHHISYSRPEPTLYIVFEEYVASDNHRRLQEVEPKFLFQNPQKHKCLIDAYQQQLEQQMLHPDFRMNVLSPKCQEAMSHLEEVATKAVEQNHREEKEQELEQVPVPPLVQLNIQEAAPSMTATITYYATVAGQNYDYIYYYFFIWMWLVTIFVIIKRNRNNVEVDTQVQRRRRTIITCVLLLVLLLSMLTCSCNEDSYANEALISWWICFVVVSIFVSYYNNKNEESNSKNSDDCACCCCGVSPNDIKEGEYTLLTDGDDACCSCCKGTGTCSSACKACCKDCCDDCCKDCCDDCCDDCCSGGCSDCSDCCDCDCDVKKKVVKHAEIRVYEGIPVAIV